MYNVGLSVHLPMIRSCVEERSVLHWYIGEGIFLS